MLSPKFVDKYKNKQPDWGFGNLGYVVYKRTYARTLEDGRKEEWWQTVERVINGMLEIGVPYTDDEAERLYDLVFNLKALPSGRALWQLGSKFVNETRLANSLLNCWTCSISSIDDFCFVFMQSMFGGGVGCNVSKEFTFELPRVKKDVKCRLKNTKDADYIVPDSKEGWCDLWRKILEAYLINGKSFTYSTVCIRSQGEPLKTFGGIAPGPMPLIKGTELLCSVLENRCGKKLRSSDVCDIICIGGEIVKSGGIRRCLPEGSLVHTKYGLIPIEDIKIGDLVLTQDGYEKVADHIKQGTQDSCRIYTQDGWFDCTPDHRMAVLNKGFGVSWKMAKELTNEDVLMTSRIPIVGIQQKMPIYSCAKPLRSTTCKDIVIPDLDKDLAWFIGIFQADGYTHINKEINPTKGYISGVFSINEYNIALKFKEQVERFGVIARLQKRNSENSWSVICTSKQLAEYLHLNVKKPNIPMSVPDFILKNTTEIKMSYVSGLFDGDGCDTNRPFLLLSSVYENFSRQVQSLLYSCGISTRLSFDKGFPSRDGWQTAYKLSIINNIDKELWNNSYGGSKRLAKIGKPQYANGYPMNWISNESYEKRSVCGYSSNDKIVIDRYLEVFKELKNYTPVKVKFVESIGPRETYDISVENNHNFYCNGYLTHNTALILQGDADDSQFLGLKRWDKGNIPNFRSNSNNSVLSSKYEYLSDKFWDGYTGNGEPYGLVNLNNARRYGRTGETKFGKFDLAEPNIIACNPCLAGDSEVRTKDGTSTINKIKIGDEIWSEDGWVKVINKIDTGIKTVYQYGTSSGYINCTKNHRVVSNGNLIEIQHAQSIDLLSGPEDNANAIVSEEILSAVKIGEMEVFDITVDGPNNTFWCDGFNVSNCAEMLGEHAEPCNLAELALNNLSSKDEMLEAAILLYKYQKHVCTMNYYHEESNQVCHRNMKIGLGVTGVLQRPEVFKEWCDYVYTELRKFDEAWSKQYKYPQSIRLTVVKPSGTLSLLTGSTPGCHPGFSHHFIRRVRFSSNDPILTELRKANYKLEYEKNFDGTFRHDVVICEFPCKFDPKCMVSKNLTAVQHLDIVKDLQKTWADQAVSVTIYYKKEELSEIKEWLKLNYDDNIKSLSFLLHQDHGFSQAPLEEINQEKFDQTNGKIKPIDLSSVTATSTTEFKAEEECKNGVCPIK